MSGMYNAVSVSDEEDRKRAKEMTKNKEGKIGAVSKAETQIIKRNR
jgi:hypothetical protein